jgi:superfamily II DNA or RNA helicase
MPRGIYSKLICAGEKKEKFTPLTHQKQTRDFFLNSPYRGLLLFHKLGSGKTCTAILVADALLKKNMVKHVYILTPGSLRSGWISEYCEKCGFDKDLFRNNYTFITYNYAVGRTLPNFDNSLIIIDEVHNLINGVRNQTNNPTLIYNKIIQSKNSRVLALSGTVIYNNSQAEFPLLVELLKPGILSEWSDLFNILDDGTVIPNNPTRLKRKLEGIISFFPGSGDEFVPKIMEMPPIKVEMTNDQLNNYVDAIAKEEAAFPPEEKLKYRDPERYKIQKQLYIMAQKKILSRLASNFFYPPDILIKADKLVDDDEEEPEKKKLVMSENVKIVFRDILEAKEDYIVQQCNCTGNTPQGLAKQIAIKFNCDPYSERKEDSVPGTYDICNGKKNIVCLFAQYQPGRPKRKNDSKERRLKWFRESLGSFLSENDGSVALPYGIGCGLGGGDWNDYIQVINEVADITDRKLFLYKLGNKKEEKEEEITFQEYYEGHEADFLVKSDKGWIEKSKFDEGQLLKIYSPKVSSLILNIAKNIGVKHLVFTYFKTKAGANLIKNILNLYGVKAEVFSGDLDDKQRKALLKRFNSNKNMYGEKIKVLIVTEAGAEGIDLKEVRHIHIFESSPIMSKVIQAIGRAARYKSHSRLPPEERDVKVWKYLSIAISRKTKEQLEESNLKPSDYNYEIVDDKVLYLVLEKSIDEELNQKGETKLREIRSFLKLLEDLSVT